MFSAVFVLGCGVFLLLKYTSGAGATAEIWLDGELVETIDLGAVTIAYDLVFETEYGRNVVHVEHGAISVSEADCPDQVCVEQGAISGPGIPVVCMPHRLVIEIEGEP